jgi:hypothetical protein
VLFVYYYNLGGKTISNVRLNASLSIRGINYYKSGDDNSMHGLVLTSISHTLH